MKWAALIAWVITAGGGFVLLSIWLMRGGMRQQQEAGNRIRPPLILSHFLLAAGGLVVWIIYLINDKDALAWGRVRDPRGRRRARLDDVRDLVSAPPGACRWQRDRRGRRSRGAALPGLDRDPARLACRHDRRARAADRAEGRRLGGCARASPRSGKSQK